jgi:hypothetical protein
MSVSIHPHAVTSSDDRTTIVAIAVLAFVSADVAHEVLGHGLGYLIAGGRSGIFTTTRLIPAQRLNHTGAKLFDIGGPFGNLLFAALPWMAQRLFAPPAPRLRLFLWLFMALNLFWGVGYIIFSGVVARGDWFALIQDLSYLWLWCLSFVVVGIGLYRASIRLVSAELRWIVSRNEGSWQLRVRRVVLLSYIAGGLISCVGAALDPRGTMEVLNSGALSGFAAAVGLLWVPVLFPLVGIERDTALVPMSRSYVWILAGLAVSVFFIAVLGPGIKFAF